MKSLEVPFPPKNLAKHKKIEPEISYHKSDEKKALLNPFFRWIVELSQVSIWYQLETG